VSYSPDALEALSRLVEIKLKDFGVEVEVVAVHPGPVVTRFEMRPAPGVKVATISGLAKDLARSLSAISVRVVEVIPGKPVMGLEIPNEKREIVTLGEIIKSRAYEDVASPLTLALGKDIGGAPMVADLARMPHLLIAGTTGSGKSVGINAMVLSLLYKATAEHVRMIMIDPKMLELSVYEGIPHLLAPVVTDMKQAANALRWSVAEMERRYQLMAALGVRNITGFNRKVKDAIEAASASTKGRSPEPRDRSQAVRSRTRRPARGRAAVPCKTGPGPVSRVSRSIRGSLARLRPWGCSRHSSALRSFAAQPPAATMADSRSSARQVPTARSTASRSASAFRVARAAARWCGALVWSLIQPSRVR
jgi:hypothetical protein